jgi:hypothetical protein
LEVCFLVKRFNFVGHATITAMNLRQDTLRMHSLMLLLDDVLRFSLGTCPCSTP